ncbi:hypothetical protein ABG874_04990 [Bifidobacterium pseudocatenulatum]|uniref:hypothetical protein n=1 Tax=Bifidobacterium pseudocatenulatum TaxID=28026 RepID=UPI00325A91A1
MSGGFFPLGSRYESIFFQWVEDFSAEGFVSVCFSPVSGGFGTLEENASILEKTADSVFLLSERHSFDADGELVEYVRSFLDPSHFTMHVTVGERSLR